MGFYVIALGSNESHLRHSFTRVSKGMNFEKVKWTIESNQRPFTHYYSTFKEQDTFF